MKNTSERINSYYDRQKAQSTMDTMIRERITIDEHLLSQQTEQAIKGAVIMSIDRELTWRLALEDEDMTQREYVFAIEGILVKAMLPPLRKVPSTKANKLQQSIQILGFGAQEFERSVNIIREAYMRFTKRLGSAIEPWVPSTFEDHTALDFANRYFESVSLGDKLNFWEGVDPSGVLAQLAADNNLHHTEDNEVQFWDYVFHDEKRMFKKMEPQELHVGDVVEAQFSFVLVPLKADRGHKGHKAKPHRYRLRLKMRSIARMDTELTDDAQRAKYAQEDKDKAKKKETIVKNDMKRKVGY